MVTICAPAYGNIFMTEFEQKYIYPLIKDINSFLTLYWWYSSVMDQIRKTAKRFYEWAERKTLLYKVWLQILMQGIRVLRHFSLYRSTK